MILLILPPLAARKLCRLLVLLQPQANRQHHAPMRGTGRTAAVCKFHRRLFMGAGVGCEPGRPGVSRGADVAEADSWPPSPRQGERACLSSSRGPTPHSSVSIGERARMSSSVHRAAASGSCIGHSAEDAAAGDAGEGRRGRCCRRGRSPPPGMPKSPVPKPPPVPKPKPKTPVPKPPHEPLGRLCHRRLGRTRSSRSAARRASGSTQKRAARPPRHRAASSPCRARQHRQDEPPHGSGPG
jgi:hypothetical protein